MTVLQLPGPMGLRVLQWCHPMLAYAKRASYCTRIITLYGARKGDSGPRISLPFLVDPTIVGGLQIILQFFFSLNPKPIRLNTL